MNNKLLIDYLFSFNIIDNPNEAEIKHVEEKFKIFVEFSNGLDDDGKEIIDEIEISTLNLLSFVYNKFYKMILDLEYKI